MYNEKSSEPSPTQAEDKQRVDIKCKDMRI
jgi:hypothetical protein